MDNNTNSNTNSNNNNSNSTNNNSNSYSNSNDNIKLLSQVLGVPTNPLLLQYISSNKSSYEEISRILTKPSQLLDKCPLTGITPLHAAVLVQNVDIVKVLLKFYRIYATAECRQQIIVFQNERNRTIQMLRRNIRKREELIELAAMSEKDKAKAEKKAQSRKGDESPKDDDDFSKYDNDPKILAVYDWFTRETESKNRELEFKIETFFGSLLQMKDKEGRTPIHYALLYSSSLDLLSLLLNGGKGNFHVDDKNDGSKQALLKKRMTFINSLTTRLPIEATFEADIMYEIATGRIVGSSQRKTDNFVAPSKNIDDDNNDGVSPELRSVIYDLINLGHLDKYQSKGNKQVTYEIVVPWVLRNLLKRCAELGASRDDSGVEYFEKLIKKYDKRDTGLILIPELKLILEKVDIRVTDDVLREICRMYAADISATREKWNELSEEIERKRQIELDSMKLSNGDKKSDHNDDGYNGGAKGYRDDRNRDRDAKGSSIAEDKGGGSEEKGSDSKASSSSSSNTKKPKEMILNEADMEFGISIQLLVNDLKNGRGLKSLDWNTTQSSQMNTSKIHEEVNNESKEEGKESKQDDDDDNKNNDDDDKKKKSKDKKGASTEQFLMKKVKIVTNGVPPFASLSTIKKYRNAIVNSVDNIGQTPLFLAASAGMKSHIEFLLRHGADISISNLEGKSVVSVAKGKDIQNMLEGSLVSWLSKSTSASVPKANKTFGDSLSFGKTNSQNIAVDDALVDEFISSSKIDDRSRVVLNMQIQLQQLQDHRWSYSRSPLSWAVNNGLIEAVREMLLNGAEPNTKDAVGRTPLHECLALAGCSKTDSFAHAALSIAERLMEAGAQLNVTSISGRTPLHEIFCKDQDNSKSSYNRDGAGNASYKPSKIRDKDAIAQYRRLLVRNMLQWGADPYIKDRHGLAPIHYCARENMSGCLVEILRAGYDAGYPTAQGQTCLHFASKAGALKAIHLICRWDADYRYDNSIITRKDKKGTYPVQLLPTKTLSKCFDTLWVVVRLGDVAKTLEILNDLKRSRQALWIEMESTEDDVDAMAMLRSSLNASMKGFKTQEQELWLLDGIDTKSRRSSWTALHSCIVGQAEFEATKVCDGRPKINISARKALELPPLANTNTSTNRVALLGPSSKHENIIRLLLEHEAFVDSCDVNCRTPLMYAAAADLHNVCKILFEAGADLQSKDLDGNTPLHFAYMYGSKNAVAMLESLGADDSDCNNFNREPLSEAGREKTIKPIFFNKKEKSLSSSVDKNNDMERTLLSTSSSSSSFKNSNLKIETYQDEKNDRD